MMYDHSVSGLTVDDYGFWDVEHPISTKNISLPENPHVGTAETHTHPPSMMGYGTTTLAKELFC